MASPYVFGAATYEPVYLSQTYSGMENGLTDATMAYIRPDLQSSSPVLFSDSWEIQAHRLPKNLQAVFFPDMPMQMASRTHARPTAGIPPVLPPSHRFQSPISSSEPSPSMGSALSPPADTESYNDNVPRTPPDTAFSPFQPLTPLEPCSNAHAVQFTSMGPSMGSDYVNPVDVNSSQQPDYSESENGTADFSFSQRTYSYDSQPANHSDAELAQNAVTGFGAPRMDSPEGMRSIVGEEIKASSQYPLPPKSEETDVESDGDIAVPRLKRLNEDDRDGDYRPSKKLRPNAKASPRRAARAKQHAVAPADANMASTSRSPVPVGRKRTRAGQLPSRPPPPSAGTTRTALACRSCAKNDFQDQAELDLHIKKRHTRPFNCVFDFAGCDSTFASKNEWKRHVSSQHLLLHYWLCTGRGCCKASNAENPSYTTALSTRSKTNADASPSPDQPAAPNGSIFNRKDLFTQHLKRMHAPQEIKHIISGSPSPPPSTSSKKTPVHQSSKQPHSPEISRLLAEWDRRLQDLHTRCIRARCQLPQHMTCPVPGCDVQPFNGDDAWNLRMEHVAKHMERAGQGQEPKVVFGGEADPTLVQWAGRADVAIIVPRKEGAGGNVVVTAPVLSAETTAVSAWAAAGEEVIKGEIVVVAGDYGDGEWMLKGEDD
ncbi:Zinc finger protein ZIC 5 [Madurella mycetomatis]|uniref:Zinc finger protein ZIC 5 n=1 Tax=Madurella mycetomatis TaxID=100816 RepID=A0A175W6T6_9PEZI|nr:Zinc finger protein ZIC 5 [Madurella mycetomatis]